MDKAQLLEWSTPWKNYYFRWNKKETILKELKDFLQRKGIPFNNVSELENALVILGDTKCKCANLGFVGYDTTNILHIGSLTPFVFVSYFGKKYGIKEMVISLNDIEAISSRGITYQDSELNSRRILKVIESLHKSLEMTYQIKYSLRSQRKDLIIEMAEICSLSELEKLVEIAYGRPLPYNHFLSILVMMAELYHWNKNNNILTAYGIEEVQHLVLYYKIKKYLQVQNNFLGIVFLPIVGRGSSCKKMSKSEPNTAIFLTKENIKQLSKYDEPLEQVYIIFNKTFPEKIKEKKDLINILDKISVDK